MPTPHKILAVEQYKIPQKNGFLLDELAKKNYSHEAYGLGTEQTLAVLLKSFLIPKRLANYDVILTHDYFTAFGINLRLLLTGGKPKHIVIGLNQSRRLLKTKFGFVNQIIDRVFRRSDLIIVHSRREASLFERMHNIPASKFYFSPWGYDLPPTSVSRFSSWPRPYVSLVGRNNRDVETFIKAVEGTAIDGLIVTSRSQQLPDRIPANVHVFFDLPMDETLDCIKNALANTILLNDNERGAGHITAVSAMFLGTPQIVSDASVITDYFVTDITAITVPLGDALAARKGIEALMSDRRYSERLVANARRYAEQWLTNESATGRIVRAIASLVERQPLATVDREWLEEYNSLVSRRGKSA